jgi:hypothetical protein
MSTEPQRTCPSWGNEFSGAMEFCRSACFVGLFLVRRSPASLLSTTHRQRDRMLIDLEFIQKGLQGNPIRVKGILNRVVTSGVYINTRQFRMKLFDRGSGFEVGKKAGLHFDPQELQRKLMELPSEDGDRYLTEAPMQHG